MAVMPLVIAPDQRLNTPSVPVPEVNDEVRELLNDMVDTMYFSRGIGLAAVQVGVMSRVAVVDVHWREDDDHTPRTPLKMVNPKVVWASEEMGTYKEGCLSYPDMYSDVARPARCRVSYLDETGAQKEIEADGLLATCIQHEVDHTDGIVFVDHISRLKREMIIKKLTKLKKAGVFDEHDHDHGHVHGPNCSHGHHHDEMM